MSTADLLNAAAPAKGSVAATFGLAAIGLTTIAPTTVGSTTVDSSAAVACAAQFVILEMSLCLFTDISRITL